ncbi:unnamed protein product [Chondrus crispus]|uniref:Ribose-5-phosphate isomerase n=1 Tax=Chondrus crispus TaxID=2769 RepID=R7QA91_CHOCR|nr:unnamed protein product [Chondrus crispus]CDF34698.1 unnamed protein product [Chondrus crispus]|eukprot:XP_005714517.1 unnamed protein product [Chondrus crispus]
MGRRENLRTGFVTPFTLTSSSSASKLSTKCGSLRKIFRTSALPTKNTGVLPARCSMEETPSRDIVLKYGIDAAVEDFIKSGLNIGIGGGKTEEVTKLVDALDSLNQVEGLIDVAFVSASPTTAALLRDRGMPSDLAVNFKKGLDVFLALVDAVDADCNAVIGSDNISGDKYAAHMADKVVLVVHEENVENSKNGLRSVPIQMVNFLPGLATESLCSGVLVDLGVRGASLRTDQSHIADLALAPFTQLLALEHQLCSMAQVETSGILLSTEKTVAVVATRDCQPFDMTSSLSSMTLLESASSAVVLTEEKRREILGKYESSWIIVPHGEGELLSRTFKFVNVDCAQAFVRYVHFISRGAHYCPEIYHGNTFVEVRVNTEGNPGITELDTLIAKELASVYQRMFSSSQLIS